MILPAIERREVARIAEAVRLAIAASPFSLENVQAAVKSIPVTISIGAAILEPATAHRFTAHGMLVQAADKAVYAAKHAGRNCVRVFSIKEPAKAA